MQTAHLYEKAPINIMSSTRNAARRWRTSNEAVGNIIVKRKSTRREKARLPCNNDLAFCHRQIAQASSPANHQRIRRRSAKSSSSAHAPVKIGKNRRGGAWRRGNQSSEMSWRVVQLYRFAARLKASIIDSKAEISPKKLL